MRLQLQVVVSGNGAQQLNATATAVSSIGRNAAAANAQTQSLISTIREMRTIIATIESARMFTAILKEGIEFNALLETSQLGLAALIGTFTIMTDSNGRTLSGIERYSVGLKMATDLQLKMKVAALETTLQYSDLLEIMQRGLPFMLKYMHDAQGNVIGSQKLVNFTTSFSQGATAFGLHPEEIGTNIQRLMMGTADPRHARFAYAILQDIGQGDMKRARDTMKLWEQQGTLYENLMNKMVAFSLLGKDAMNTYSGAMSNFKDAVEQALGEGTQNATKELTNLMLQLRDQIVHVGADGKMYFDANFVDTVRNLAEAFVKLATALGQVANVLVAIGAHLDAPNMKNLTYALAGAIGGGLVGGPLGAAAGAMLMYSSANVQDDIAAENKNDAARASKWAKSGGDVLGSLVPGPDGHGFGIAAGPGFMGANATERDKALDMMVGKLLDDFTQDQLSVFKAALVSRSQTHHYNVGSGNDYFQRDISYQDFIKARKEAQNYTGNKVDVKSPLELPDAEKARQAALALERYREVLERIGQQLDQGKLKDSAKAASDSFDVLIDRAKEMKDPFAVIDLEKQKALVKATNEYGADLDRIAKMQTDLDNAKAKADLSKQKPSDAAAELKVQTQINASKIQAFQTYLANIKKATADAGAAQSAAANKMFDEADKRSVEVFKNAVKEHEETGVSMTIAMQSAAIDSLQEMWELHYRNRQKMAEQETQREKDLYSGLVNSIKQGTQGIADALMQGGHGNPFEAVYKSFQTSWSQYLGSFTDKWMNELSIIASGEHTPYGYTKKGETGELDPGGLPKYATPEQQRRARLGLAVGQGAVAAYGLYQAGQNGATKGQNAMSGAMAGFSIGAETGNIYAMVIGAVVGAAFGYLTGKAKVGYNVNVVNGKIVVSGSGSANAQDVSAALQGINQTIEQTANSAYGVLFQFPGLVMQSLASFKPGSLTQNGSRWFDNNTLKLFLQVDVPKMVFSAFQPALMTGLSAIGVTYGKLGDIFSRTSDPSFDAKDFLSKLNSYVSVILGLQDAMKFLGATGDKADLANKALNKPAYDQINEIDQKIIGISGLFSSMTWDEQVAAGQQLLSLTQQRVQIEQQALVAFQNAWESIKATGVNNKDQIAYSELTDPFDSGATATAQHNYWNNKAVTSLNGLLGQYNNPNATVDDINKFSGEAMNAAMQLYQIDKARYNDEIALVHQIDDAIKSVDKSFDDAKFAITFDQARTGVDDNGNPIYDKQKQVDLLQGQQRDLFDQLNHATTYDEVQRITGEIQKNSSQIYDLLGKTPEAARLVLAQLTEAEKQANTVLAILRQNAQTEADKYKDAANEAINIINAASDIANAALAQMKAQVTALDPAVWNAINLAMGQLTGTIPTTTTDVTKLGDAADRTADRLDRFGDRLDFWSGRGGSQSATPVQSQSVPVNVNVNPTIIVSGGVAAVADMVEIRIGNKITRQAVNTIQRAARGSAF
jgi:hypothetical protein